MRILGIDTASPTASVAIVEDGALVAEATHGRAGAPAASSSPALKGNHAEVILPLIQSVLVQSKCLLDELAGIAVSIGPGSFTGLRIGLATVKGLAYDWDLPVIGVSTLMANAARAKNFDGLICSMLDARKREVYMALFESDGRRPTRVTDDAIISLQGAMDLVQTYRSVDGRSMRFVGDGAKVYEKILIDVLAPSVLIDNGHSSVAAEVAVLAEERFRRCVSDDLGALAPIYLRSAEAESKIR
jgi:tRNA threonylcarbamoyladenosine biosynthesis protein TsaB